MEISFFMVSKGDGGVEIGSGSARWQCYASGYVIVLWHCHGVEMDDVVMSGIGNTSTVVCWLYGMAFFGNWRYLIKMENMVFVFKEW